MKNIEESNKCKDCRYFRSEFNEFVYQRHNYCIKDKIDPDMKTCFEERSFKDDLYDIFKNIILLIACLALGVIIGLATR